MASYERRFSGLGSDVDRELAAAWGQVNVLKQAVASLRLEVNKNAELLRVLQKSQQTRSNALQKSRAREADLKSQLEALGIEVKDSSPRETIFRTKGAKGPVTPSDGLGL